MCRLQQFSKGVAHKADIVKKSFQNKLPKYYDGVVVFVLDDQADEEEYRQIDGMPERTLLIVNGKSKILEAEVKRYIAVQYYYSKKDELAKDDPTVVNELTLYLGEQESIVSELIRKWRSLQFQGTFVMLNGIVQNISSDKELSSVLSDIMDATYDRTLIVNNDLLNKNVLSGAIKQARKKALEYIMEQEDVYSECGFLSPEFNIITGRLCLVNTHGPVIWMPFQHMPRDEYGTISIDKDNKEIPTAIMLGNSKPLSLKKTVEYIWTGAVVQALECLFSMDKTKKMQMAQYQIFVSRLWSEISRKTGYLNLVNYNNSGNNEEIFDELQKKGLLEEKIFV